LELYK